MAGCWVWMSCSRDAILTGRSSFCACDGICVSNSATATLKTPLICIDILLVPGGSFPPLTLIVDHHRPRYSTARRCRFAMPGSGEFRSCGILFQHIGIMRQK